MKRTLVHPLSGDLIALIRVQALARESEPADALFCEEYLRTTPEDVLNPAPLISGDDLIRSGFRPGPQFKEILDQVRDAQLEGCISTAAEAMTLAKKLSTEAH